MTDKESERMQKLAMSLPATTPRELGLLMTHLAMRQMHEIKSEPSDVAITLQAALETIVQVQVNGCPHCAATWLVVAALGVDVETAKNIVAEHYAPDPDATPAHDAGKGEAVH